MKVKILMVLMVCVAAFIAVPDAAMANASLPNYASTGDASTKAQSVGKKVTDFIALGVGILAIIGILVGAGFFATGNRERGMQYLMGGIIALVISGMVYGIARLVI